MKTREVDVEVVADEPQPPSGANRRLGEDPFIAFVSKMMDTAFSIPGTNIRFGLDPIIGLLPGLGDTAGAVISTVLIFQSARYGVPRVIVGRMALNVLLNTVLGAMPVVGDAFSVFFKSNARNYELLRKHAGTQQRTSWADWAFVICILAALLIVTGLVIFAVLGLAATFFREVAALFASTPPAR